MVKRFGIEGPGQKEVKWDQNDDAWSLLTSFYGILSGHRVYDFVGKWFLAVWSKIRYYRALWLKKWFDCAYLFTVILIYGRTVSTFSMTVSTFWFWFFIITRGACELVLGGMVTINVFFPFGELSSRLHPPKNQKTNSDHHFGKKEDCTSNLKEKTP